MISNDRLSAFTDAIAAIAATIMVLELGVPKTDDWSGLLAQKNVLMAYIVSYMMIYFAWYMHHNLFTKAEIISVKAFLINGLWLLFLTLVPFTTAWVGRAGNTSAPRVLYTLDMLLWALAFHWLEHQVQKDNPEVIWDNSYRFTDKLILYGGFAVCLLVALLLHTGVVQLVGLISVIMIVRAWKKAVKEKKNKAAY